MGVLIMYGILEISLLFDKPNFTRVLCHLDQKLGKYTTKVLQFKTTRNNNRHLKVLSILILQL